MYPGEKLQSLTIGPETDRLLHNMLKRAIDEMITERKMFVVITGSATINHDLDDVLTIPAEGARLVLTVEIIPV